MPASVMSRNQGTHAQHALIRQLCASGTCYENTRGRAHGVQCRNTLWGSVRVSIELHQAVKLFPGDVFRSSVKLVFTIQLKGLMGWSCYLLTECYPKLDNVSPCFPCSAGYPGLLYLRT